MALSTLTDEERKVYGDIALHLCGSDYEESFLIPLKMALSLETAKVFLAMPGSAEEIAAKTGCTSQFADNAMQELYHKGYAVLTRKRGYQPARSVIQVIDTGPIPEIAAELGREYFTAIYSSMAKFPALVLSAMPIPLLKVMCHVKALEMSGISEDEILPQENINLQMKEASTIAAHFCGCRRVIYGGESPEDGFVCLCFDFMAEYEVKRGSARMLSYEEAVELEEKLAKRWNIITPQNGTYLDAFCNCSYECPCIYEELGRNNQSYKEGVAPSRYQAVVDPQKCISCQQCVVKCKALACSMVKYIDETKYEYENNVKYKAWVDPDRCLGCGCCVINCKAKALSMITVRPPEYIEPAPRPEAGRYDRPDKYAGIVSKSTEEREARKRLWADMEERFCLENNVDRDPYRGKEMQINSLKKLLKNEDV